MAQEKNNNKASKLFDAILSLKNKNEVKDFFQDLCTVEELKNMSDRWAIVLLLLQDNNYRDIATKLKVSTTTVSRVASWLENGTGGYWIAINRNPKLYKTSKTGKIRVSLIGKGITTT